MELPVKRGLKQVGRKEVGYQARAQDELITEGNPGGKEVRPLYLSLSDVGLLIGAGCGLSFIFSQGSIIAVTVLFAAAISPGQVLQNLI